MQQTAAWWLPSQTPSQFNFQTKAARRPGWGEHDTLASQAP